MRVAKDISELNKRLLSLVSDVMDTEVYETVKKTEKESLDQTVYRQYHPKWYKRRGDDGGLSDDSNIIRSTKSSGKTVIMDVKNITQFKEYNESNGGRPYSHPTANSGTGLAELVEYGSANGRGYEYGDESDTFRKPRPFTQTTVEWLESTGECKDALARGLIARGCSVE